MEEIDKTSKPIESGSFTRENLSHFPGQPKTDPNSVNDINIRVDFGEDRDVGSFFPWYTEGEDGPITTEPDWAGDSSTREFPPNDD